MGKTLFGAVLSAVTVFGASGLWAGESMIPATANWAVHFDGQAFAETRIGTAIEARPRSNSEQEQMALAKDLLGFDFERDLHAITVYGPDKDKANAVLIARGNFEPGRVTSYLAQRASFVSAAHQGHQILQWYAESGQKLFRIPGAMAFHTSGTAIFSATVEGVREGLDLLDGQVNGTSIQLPADASAPYFVAFGNLKNLGEIQPEAALLRQSKRIALAVGEADEHLNVRLTLEGDNVESARQIEAVVSGIQAYALLRSTGDWAGIPDWLLTGTVVREDSVLHFFLDAPVEKVVNLVEKHLRIR